MSYNLQLKGYAHFVPDGFEVLVNLVVEGNPFPAVLVFQLELLFPMDVDPVLACGLF